MGFVAIELQYFGCGGESVGVFPVRVLDVAEESAETGTMLNSVVIAPICVLFFVFSSIHTGTELRVRTGT